MRCRCWAGGCPWTPGNIKSTPTRSSARQRTRSSRRLCGTRARRGKLEFLRMRVCVACWLSSFVDDVVRVHESCSRRRSPRLPSWQILSSRPIAAREGGHLSAHDRGDMISGDVIGLVVRGRIWRISCVHVLMQLALYASVRGLSWHTHNQHNEHICANFCMRGGAGVLYYYLVGEGRRVGAARSSAANHVHGRSSRGASPGLGRRC